MITSLSLLATSAHAGVGETVKQVEARYGEPQRVLRQGGSFRELGYGYHGFMVGVSYVDGISKSEGFARPDVTAIIGRGCSAASHPQFSARHDLETRIGQERRSCVDPERWQSRCAA